MPLCGKCHREAPSGALFCAFCGAAIVPEPAPGEAPDPYIGQTFKGMYFIQQRIGGGGMGHVYKAQHVTLDAPVALKILKKALLSDPAVVERFHREARAASRLRHPRVIAVTDFGQTDDGTLFMAMEYLAGRNLARLIAEDFPISERRIVHIGAQILDALAEAHANAILHRDLKPENVMIEVRRDEPDSVKVLDFGIAKIQVDGERRVTLTQAGLVCGTPGYMSPEQWSGEQLDARSDLYSVGVILYEMLTGKLPFDAQTPMELVHKHLTERPKPPSARRADHEVSQDLESLVMRALSANRDERSASAEEMRADLLACVLLPEPEGSAEPPESRQTVFLAPGSGGCATPGRGASPGPAQAGAGGGVTLPVTPAPQATPPTPGSTRRPATPGATPRNPQAASPPGSGRAVTPPLRRTPAPPLRHEEDEPEVDEEPPPPLPPTRWGTRRVVTIGVAAAVAVAVVGFGVGSLLGPKRAPGPSPPPAGSSPPGAALPAPQVPAPSSPAPPVPLPASVEPTLPEPSPAPPVAEPPPRQRRHEPVGHGNVRYVRDVLNAIPTPQRDSGDGVLSIQADPFGDVFVNGRAYGEAPREFRVEAGVYHVKAVHPQLGARQARLTVRAGDRTRWTADFLRKR